MQRMIEMATDLCVAANRQTRGESSERPSSAEVADLHKLSSVLDALMRFAGDAAFGQAPAKRRDTLLKRWGNLPLYLQHRLAEAAAEHGCAGELAAIVGELPVPDQVTAERRFYEPMF